MGRKDAKWSEAGQLGNAVRREGGFSQRVLMFTDADIPYPSFDPREPDYPDLLPAFLITTPPLYCCCKV